MTVGLLEILPDLLLESVLLSTGKIRDRDKIATAVVCELPAATVLGFALQLSWDCPCQTPAITNFAILGMCI